MVSPCTIPSHKRRILHNAQAVSVLSMYELRVPTEFGWGHCSRFVFSAQSIRRFVLGHVGPGVKYPSLPLGLKKGRKLQENLVSGCRPCRSCLCASSRPRRKAEWLAPFGEGTLVPKRFKSVDRGFPLGLGRLQVTDSLEYGGARVLVLLSTMTSTDFGQA